MHLRPPLINADEYLHSCILAVGPFIGAPHYGLPGPFLQEIMHENEYLDNNQGLVDIQARLDQHNRVDLFDLIPLIPTLGNEIPVILERRTVLTLLYKPRNPTLGLRRHLTNHPFEFVEHGRFDDFGSQIEVGVSGVEELVRDGGKLGRDVYVEFEGVATAQAGSADRDQGF